MGRLSGGRPPQGPRGCLLASVRGSVLLQDTLHFSAQLRAQLREQSTHQGVGRPAALRPCGDRGVSGVQQAFHHVRGDKFCGQHGGHCPHVLGRIVQIGRVPEVDQRLFSAAVKSCLPAQRDIERVLKVHGSR